MRTNIEIDDKLMADAMAAGGFKTKREAVEAGLRLVSRRKVYDGLLALRGKLHWDDSDEGWAQVRTQQALVAEDAVLAPHAGKKTPARPGSGAAKRSRSK